MTVGVFPQTTLTLKKAIPNRLAQSQRLPVMESVSVGGRPKAEISEFLQGPSRSSICVMMFLGVQ